MLTSRGSPPLGPPTLDESEIAAGAAGEAWRTFLAERGSTLGSIGQHADSLLTPDGIVIAEHGRKMSQPLAECYGPLRRYRVLEQGDAGLSFYAR